MIGRPCKTFKLLKLLCFNFNQTNKINTLWWKNIYLLPIPLQELQGRPLRLRISKKKVKAENEGEKQDADAQLEGENQNADAQLEGENQDADTQLEES